MINILIFSALHVCDSTIIDIIICKSYSPLFMLQGIGLNILITEAAHGGSIAFVHCETIQVIVSTAEFTSFWS